MRNTIEVQHLTKRYGPVSAVADISFTVPECSICALLGTNGAGKTTTLAVLLGLLIPDQGRVSILGEDMLRHRYRVLPRMNFSSPYVDLPQRLTVTENLEIYARLYGVHSRAGRITELAEVLDLTGLLDRPYRTLSAGQKTRVALAKALINQPEVLLLDEPTASLDPDSADRIRTYLTNYQSTTRATILLASHNMAEVERICRQVMIMRAGRIVDAGQPENLIARYGRRTLEEVFLDVIRSDLQGEVAERSASVA
ncbi:MAG: ABC transporter ATP-binding protein [Gammaproteobacteria bacterium]|nr:ABC transporter ATP-binding protein [Gammaproteobacteria bacterium]